MNRSATLAAAELDAQKARSRFRDTAAAMKARFAPSRMIGDAVTGARCHAAEFAHSASNKARANPVAATVVAGGTLLLLASGPLFRKIRQLFHQHKA
jgi:hypothetical protein